MAGALGPSGKGTWILALPNGKAAVLNELREVNWDGNLRRGSDCIWRSEETFLEFLAGG